MYPVDELKINVPQPIEYTKKVLWFFSIKKSFQLETNMSDFRSYKDSLSKLHLNILGVPAKNVIGHNHLILREWHHTGLIHLFFYLINDGEKVFRVLEITDIIVKPKFRNLGIGSKLFRIIEDVCRQNSIEFIFARLDSKGDLESRKRFFIKNGFEFTEDYRFGLSGICAAKYIK